MGVRRTLLTIATVGAGVVFSGWKFTARGAYESAPYTVLESDASFEVRKYPDMTVAVTDMAAGPEENNGSFMRLFRYISGANAQEQKIEMTTPVFMESAGENAPGQMGFVIPQKVADNGSPAPTAKQVRIATRPGGLFAVIRFAGRMNSESIKQAEDKLRGWIKKRGLSADGPREYAGYDPPWTPGPFRRNEVLIRLQSHPNDK